MTTLEVLQKARGLIEDPAHWIRGWGWWDSEKGEGETCAVGAVRVAVVGRVTQCTCHSCGGFSEEACKAVSALASVAGVVGEEGVVGYNDSHSHECVLAMYDAAIEQEQAA